MEWLLLTVLIDHAGSGFEAPRASSREVFSSQKDCEDAILKIFQIEGYFKIGKDITGIYGKWSGADFDGYYVCAPFLPTRR
jgi:hypothetical protein